MQAIVATRPIVMMLLSGSWKNLCAVAKVRGHEHTSNKVPSENQWMELVVVICRLCPNTSLKNRNQWFPSRWQLDPLVAVAFDNEELSCTLQGNCLVAVSPRDTHLLFAEGREETLEIHGKLQAKMFGTRACDTLSVSSGNAPFPRRIKVAHRRTAREGEKWPKCRSSDSQQKEYYKSVQHSPLGNFWIRRSQAFFRNRQNASLTNFCTLSLGSHEVVGSADAFAQKH